MLLPLEGVWTSQKLRRAPCLPRDIPSPSPLSFSPLLSFLPPDQELKLYDWCCNQAGSAHLCNRYSEKRPKIGCDGYQLPGTGGFAACVCWGDAVLVPRAAEGKVSATPLLRQQEPHTDEGWVLGCPHAGSAVLWAVWGCEEHLCIPLSTQPPA